MRLKVHPHDYRSIFVDSRRVSQRPQWVESGDFRRKRSLSAFASDTLALLM
jgi:hypothetical protein